MLINKIVQAIISLILLILVVFLCSGCSTSDDIKNIQAAGRPANIQPEYSGIVLPPNIAPLNFIIKEAGEDYVVEIHSQMGKTLRIKSSSDRIQIPAKEWKRLLAENRGQQLTVDILVKQPGGQWQRFDSIVNQIAEEDVDGYVVYRKFGPLFNQWGKMGVFQYSLEYSKEKPVLLNRLTLNNCMNCHNFWLNGTDRWLLHLRNAPGTTMLLSIDDEVRKVDTRTSFNKSPAGYPAWHPSGNLVAFSVGRPLQFFHTVGETRDELDRYLDIIVYDIPGNTVTTMPQISSPERIEVWPAWSMDGGYLYFCSAPKFETFQVTSLNGSDSLAYTKIKYDLMRIAYNQANRTWGELETVISSAETGLSVTQPKISPDGRFLVFTASGYGSFPIFHADADLYLLDLKSQSLKRLELNSDRAEGYHSWSSNNRWIVFASKRQDTQFTSLYISHIDSLGHTSNPFIVPQYNPQIYETNLEIYNVPEFIKEPIRVSPQALVEAAFSEQDILKAKLDPAVISGKTTPPPPAAAQVQFPLGQEKKNR